MRMQKFSEDKDACSALPFFELDDAQMKEATAIQWDTQPFVLKSKLHSAAKEIKKLKTSLHCAHQTIFSMRKMNKLANSFDI